MRARLHDPHGPHLPRLVLPILGVACMAIALYWRMVDGPAIAPSFFIGLALATAGSLIGGRHAPRDVDALVAPGRVRIRGAGVLRQTLHARDILAAYWSQLGGGVTLALVRRGRASVPILLQVAEADAAELRDALRIGPRGFGTLSWPVARRRSHTLSAALRWAGAACGLGLAVSAAMGGLESDLARCLGFFLAVPFPVFGLVLAAHARATRARGCLVLSETAVRVPVEDGGYRVPYASIVRVQDERDGFRLVREPANRSIFAAIRSVRHARHGMTDAERAHAIAQIRAASRRARDAPDTADLGAAGALARQADEGSHAWLVRLEAAARLVAAGVSAGYRGSGIAEADLWAALENREADADVRAAAARVLSRAASDGDHAARRIDAIVDAMRDDETAKRIRIAMDPDLEAASRALEELDPLPSSTLAELAESTD